MDKRIKEAIQTINFLRSTTACGNEITEKIVDKANAAIDGLHALEAELENFKTVPSTATEAYTPRQIVDAIKINVELASVNGKPITAEVSIGEASKDYIIGLIEAYAIEESRKVTSSIFYKQTM